MSINKLIITIFVILSLINMTFAWSANGHMLVAQIAKLDIQQKNPALFNQLETIVEYINDQTDGKSQDFVQAACWPDDIRGSESKWNQWHFTNLIYNPTQYPFQEQPEINNNVTYAIPFLTNQLTNLASLDQTTQSQYLRLLIHFVGDIHQPLHCTDYVSQDFPSGDNGGNLFKVSGDGLPSNMELHAYWDRLAYGIPYWNRPLSSSSQSALLQVAQQIMQNYTRASQSNKLSEQDVNIWASESFQNAETSSYQPLLSKNTQVIDSTYQQQAFAVITQQLAVAGYRLSDLLQQIFSQQQEIKQLENKFLEKLQD